jgi:hypothetical protein
LGALAISATGVYAQDSSAGAKAVQTAPPAADSSRATLTCLTETGSRIKPAPGQCLNVPGRVYSHEELQSTGATNLDEALSHVDPSITPGR